MAVSFSSKLAEAAEVMLGASLISLMVMATSWNTMDAPSVAATMMS